MSQKIEITKSILNILSPNFSNNELTQALKTWWVDIRKNKSNSLRLTTNGFLALQNADIKIHRIRFEERFPVIEHTNRLIIGLERYINCPWFIDNLAIYVTDDNLAVQLVLFSGNISKFCDAKRASRLTETAV